MNICHLTSTHQRYDTRIFIKECKSLRDHGYIVNLVVADSKGDEMVASVTFHDVGKSNNRLERVLFKTLRIWRKAKAINAHVIHFHDPDLIFVGIMLKLGGHKVIYDVHEDFPQAVLSREYMPIWLRKIASRFLTILENIGSRYFDAIIVATPSIARKFGSTEVSLVQNYPIQDELIVVDSIPYSNRPNNIIYHGGIARSRGILEILDAVDSVKNENCRFVLAGRFESSALEEQVKLFPGWNKTKYLNWLSRAELANELKYARVGLVLFHPEPNHINAQPNKIFEYMSVGLPLIMSDFPLWRQLVIDCNCGLLVNPLDSAAIAEAISWILEHPVEAREMGECGREALVNNYNWDEEKQTLFQVYAELKS